MADPSPTMQRLVPVGFRFRPTEEELIAHYLRHKLLAHHPSIYNAIPEFDVCKYEPWDLLAWAASALPVTDPDDSECYFFTRPDYKYSNSTRLNRTTSLGFRKVTGKDRQIKDRDTNKVIGIKKNLVFYEGGAPHGVRRNWVIHEYHDAILPPEQRTYVLCKLMKKYEKKTEEKTIDFEHELLDDKRESNINSHVDFGHENQANFSMVSEEYHLSNINSTIQTYYQLPEVVTDSITQASFQPNEDVNSFIQSYSQPNEGTYSMIQRPPQSDEIIPPEINSIVETPLDFDYEELYYSYLLQ